MAQYDGSIRINSVIETKNLKKDIQKIANDLERLKSIQKDFLDVGGSKNSSVYQEHEKEIRKLEQSLESLNRTQNEVLNEKGIPDGHFNQLKIDVEEYAKTLKELQGQGKFFGDEEYDKVYLYWKNATDAVKAYQAELNKQTESGQAREAERQEKLEAEAAIEERIAQARENAVVGNQRIIETVGRIKQLEQEIADLKLADVTEGYKDYDDRIQELKRLKQEVRDYNRETEETKKSYKKLSDTVKKAFSKINSMLDKSGEVLRNLGASVKNTFSRLDKSAGSTDKSFRSLNMGLKNILKYGFGIRSLYALFNKLRSSISEGYSNLYNDNERFRRSIDSLKASASTLKNALAAAFRPLVDIAIPYIQKVIDYMSILLNSVGQFLAAITGQKTYTKAIKQTTAAIEDQNKAQNKQLSNLDKLNNLTSDSGSGDSGESGQMFEEVPVSSYFADLAGKIKDVLSKLFAPLKEAWNREGKFVMDSWKYALTEIKDLAKSIGSDFLEVWQQEKTIKIFEDILHIVGDIGLVAGNLAHNFRLAWEENETGKKILEGVRDIIGGIVHNIRHAADVTADWSSKLNFSPLLTKIQEWVNSLVPVFDTLSGVVTDFYEKVLLPLGKWTIEKGLPELFQVLADFNAKVDWEALRTHLAEFWEHLEPFAETVGEGLIIFLDRVSDLVANFLNSDVFVDFLHAVQEWMDSVTPEDVADAIGKLITALLIFKGVAMGLSVISTISSVIGGLATAFSLLTSPVGLVISAIALLATGFVLLYQKSEGFRDFVNGIIEGVKLMIDWFKNLGTQVDVVREKVGASRSWAGAASNMGSIRPRASAYSTMVSSLQNVEFPGYATGQVIPTSMKKHLAWLGDNNRETEVVSPLSTIEQAVINAMAKVNGSNGNNGGGSVTIEIPVILNDHEIGRAVQQFDREYFKQTGKHAFA